MHSQIKLSEFYGSNDKRFGATSNKVGKGFCDGVVCRVADDILLHETFRQQGPDDEDGEEEEEQEAET